MTTPKLYARCIDNAQGICNLTIGRVYEILGVSDGGSHYYLVNDKWPEQYAYSSFRFEIVGCPCGIKGCVKHKGEQS